jgi:hypothetical protein
VNALGEGPASNERCATPVAAAPVVHPPDAPSLSSGSATDPVVLTWAPGASDGGSPVTGYRVYRGTASGAETLLGSVGVQATYSDDSVVHGTTYYYEVTAVNAAGESIRSTERAVTPFSSDTTPPSKPGAPKPLVAGTSQVALNWTASVDHSGVTGYMVYRDGGYVTTVSTTHFLDSGLKPGSSHKYQVRAYDVIGNRSALSTTGSAQVLSLGTSSTGGALAGVVYNAARGLLRNAVVSVRLPNGTVKSTKSSSSGGWKLSNLPPAQYTLTVNLSGFPTRTLLKNVTAGRTCLALIRLG